MSWYSTGNIAAEQLAASSSSSRRSRNFFTKEGESAVIRFLKPAAESFNYKRAFVKWAKGEKMLTSPGVAPDPFVEAGLSLQVSYAWPVIDRRVLEFDDKETGEKKSVGPRVMYFADGVRTRKQLVAFEKEMCAQANEELVDEGKEPKYVVQFQLDKEGNIIPEHKDKEEFNLTHYDLKVSKEKKAPWNFVAKRPKKVSKDDEALVEKYAIDLMEELKPRPLPELVGILKGQAQQTSNGDSADEDVPEYSYSSDEDDTIKFED